MNKITPSTYGDSDFTNAAPTNLAELTLAIHDGMASAMGIPDNLLTRAVDENPSEDEKAYLAFVDEAQNDAADQAITTDLVFAMFASLCPDSPWSARLLKMQALFNMMGTAIVEAVGNPDIVEALALGYNGEISDRSVAYAHAVSKLHESFAHLNPVRTETPA